MQDYLTKTCMLLALLSQKVIDRMYGLQPDTSFIFQNRVFCRSTNFLGMPIRMSIIELCKKCIFQKLWVTPFCKKTEEIYSIFIFVFISIILIFSFIVVGHFKFTCFFFFIFLVFNLNPKVLNLKPKVFFYLARHN